MALQAGGARHILEGAVTAVVEQGVTLDAGDEEVRVSVVVIVARRDADVVACAAHAGFGGHVLEGPVVPVAIEAVAVLRAGLFERWLLRAVRKVDVGIAVVIVVEYRHAAGHGFDLVPLRCGGVAQHEGDAGMRGAVLEERAGWRGRGGEHGGDGEQRGSRKGGLHGCSGSALQFAIALISVSAGPLSPRAE